MYSRIVSKKKLQKCLTDLSFIDDLDLPNGVYIFSNYPFELNLFNTLSNFITIGETTTFSLNAKKTLLNSESKSDHVAITGPNDICIVETFNHLREKLLGITILKERKNIILAIELIEKCNKSHENELLLFILICLNQQLAFRDEVRKLIKEYHSRQFIVYKSQIDLLTKQLQASKSSGEVVILSQGQIGGVFKSSMKLLTSRGIKPITDTNTFVKAYQGRKNLNIIVLAHGSKDECGADEIELEKTITVNDLLGKFRAAKIESKNFILISCWSNFITFDPKDYNVDQLIYHEEFIIEGTVYQILLQSLTVLDSLVNLDEIFNYIHLSLYLYTIQNDRLKRA